MARETIYLKFDDRDQWRSWLEKNHAIETEAWLILLKKKYRKHELTLEEAVEEALCFGWIDGKLKSLDERCYALRYSPRTPKSIWSMSNIQRAEKLIAEGKMREAGFLKIAEAKDNGEWEAAILREQVDALPKDLESALRKQQGALSAFQALPDSSKKQYIYWVNLAKRDETKRKRILKILDDILN